MRIEALGFFHCALFLFFHKISRNLYASINFPYIFSFSRYGRGMFCLAYTTGRIEMKKLILALLLASSSAYGTTVFADENDEVKVSENGDQDSESENKESDNHTVEHYQ
ncbi:hypothetical protein NVRI1_00703 [Chlamydia abortus]|nr:hypothetical protein [Chlamydia abortus]CAG9046346.1 hypothetical protein NVRI1_00703 [Chlamydia abortus]